jgi:hypothetical protein
MDDAHSSQSAHAAPPGPRPGSEWWWRPAALTSTAVALLVAAGLVLWAPWENGPACAEDEAHVADGEAGLCYAIPEGWEPVPAENLRGTPYTTVIVPELNEAEAWIGAATVHDLADGALDESDPEEAARTIAVDFATTAGDEPESVSETCELGRREAATATAVGETTSVTVQVTVVRLDEGTAALVSSSTGRNLHGHVLFDPIHRSLAVL